MRNKFKTIALPFNYESCIEANNTHVFDEIVDVLEYPPNGFDIAQKGEFDGEGEDFAGRHEEYIVESADSKQTNVMNGLTRNCKKSTFLINGSY
jgi:hypothetical protein